MDSGRTMTKLTNKIIQVNNRRTSMRLCSTEWDAMSEVCKKEHLSRNQLIEAIENSKDKPLGLTYVTRAFITEYFREAASESGHRKAGHGQKNAAAVYRILQKL